MPAYFPESLADEPAGVYYNIRLEYWNIGVMEYWSDGLMNG
jgi:hypothetical protein